MAKLAKWAEKIPGGKKVMEFLEKLFSKLPGSCPIGKNSFPAGTRVLMADGSTKPIEQVRVGDQVLSSDPATGATGARRVDGTIYTPDDRDFTDLVVQTGAKAGTLTATDHHPFWSENRQNWVDAADLQVGDQVRTASGTTATVSDVRHRTTLQAAYNLSVSDLHTYYVLAGPVSVLVHNTGLCGEKIDSVFYNPSGRSSQDQFEYHWDKHAKARGFTREKYLQDANDWATAIAQPGGKGGSMPAWRFWRTGSAG